MDARVIYAYEKEQDDELNLTIGEVLINVQKVDDGWCEGTLQSTGVRGMFPDNFVEILSTSSSSSSRNNPRPPEPRPPEPTPYVPPQVQQPQQLPQSQPDLPPPSTRNSSSAKKRRAKVTYSYAAENEDELTLVLDQVVEVINEEEEGWWKGAVNGKEGVFPSNFVEPIEEPEEQHIPPPAPKPAEKTRPPSMIAMPGLGGVSPLDLKNKLKPVMAKSPVPPPDTNRHQPQPPSNARTRSNTGSRMSRSVEKKAKVMFSYTATQEDEITVIEGEIVDIVTQETEQEGWWKVRKGGQEGLVPDNFLEALPSVEKLPPPDPKLDNPPLPPKKVEAPPKPGVPIPGARSVLPKLPDKIEQSEPKPELPAKDELEIPHNGVLDNNFVKQRPKKSNARPPSKSNLIEEQADIGNKGVEHPPADDEEKIKKPKPSPVPAYAPPTSNTPSATPSKVPGTKPKPKSGKPPPPTLSKPSPMLSQPGGLPNKSVSTGALGGHQDRSPIPKTVESRMPPPVMEQQLSVSNEWKEAFESLQEEFKKFKEEVKEDVRILVLDLDIERKKNSDLAIDVDRLKKTAGFREKK